LVTLIIFGEQYKLQCSLMSCFLEPPFTSPILDTNTVPATCYQTPPICILPWFKIPSFIPTQKTGKVMLQVHQIIRWLFLYILITLGITLLDTSLTCD
jgi:hypothetical protein